MARHGVVTADDVAVRFFWREERQQPGIWAAYKRLGALRWLGLILQDKPFAAMPAVLRVTREGARIADVGVGPAPLVLSEIQHSLAIVRVTEALLKGHPGAELTTERELRAQRYRARQAGERSDGRGRTPDALLRLPKKGAKSETIAIEVDVTRKDRRAIERVITAYDYERVDGVWWFVAPGRVERVRDVVRAMRADRRIEVRPWPT